MAERAARWQHGLNLAWLPAVLAAILVMQYTVNTTLGEVRSGLGYLLERRTMTTLESTWVDVSGITHKVTTPALDGEDPAAHAARHQQSVEALRAVYPPV